MGAVSAAELPEGLRGLTSAEVELELEIWAMQGTVEELEDERDKLEAELAEARRFRGSRRSVSVPQLERLPRLGALARWHEEIRRGARKNDAASFDDLHAAACWEQTAYSRQTEGDEAGAREAMDTALLRLHGCYGAPRDGTKEKPGPGRRLLRELRNRTKAA
jgi:hypothetical protein